MTPGPQRDVDTPAGADEEFSAQRRSCRSFFTVKLRFLICLLIVAAARGQVTFFSGGSAQTNWQAAAGGTPVVLDFESITPGTRANNASFVTYAATASVVFRPFSNSTYPEVNVGNGGIGAIGANWLGNLPATGFGTGNAISWTFSQPVRAFGFYDVGSIGSTDGFEVTVYSSGLTALGSFNTTETSGTPLFWGFTVNQNIGQVDIRPRIGNGYIGIDGISVVAVPEPSVMGLCVMGVGLIWIVRRRR